MDKNTPTPLCIDLDGTLILTDVTWITLFSFLKKYPWKCLCLLEWLVQGRAVIKRQLAEHVPLDVESLRYNKALISYLKAQPHSEIYLVTAADHKMAQPIADHLGLFKEVIASDGKVNLRAQTKADHLVERFGEKKFIYAGNSRDDLYVWKHAAAAIPVNTSPSTRRKLSMMKVKLIDITG